METVGGILNTSAIELLANILQTVPVSRGVTDRIANPLKYSLRGTGRAPAMMILSTVEPRNCLVVGGSKTLRAVVITILVVLPLNRMLVVRIIALLALTTLLMTM